MSDVGGQIDFTRISDHNHLNLLQLSTWGAFSLVMAFPRISGRSVSDCKGTVVVNPSHANRIPLDIFVPPSQVIDTVNIYYDPARHRKLSLRFLSWFLLKQDIQTAEHDSIEDARSALLLYRMYQTFVNENRFEDVMEDIFEAGKRLVSSWIQEFVLRTPAKGLLPSRASNRRFRQRRCHLETWTTRS